MMTIKWARLFVLCAVTLGCGVVLAESEAGIEQLVERAQENGPATTPFEEVKVQAEQEGNGQVEHLENEEIKKLRETVKDLEGQVAYYRKVNKLEKYVKVIGGTVIVLGGGMFALYKRYN
jgi:uncharacterized protein with ACT and thioredoxin-like domain